MKSSIKYRLLILLFMVSSFAVAQTLPVADSAVKKKPSEETYIRFDDTRKTDRPADFKVVEIASSKDKAVQKAYFYQSTKPQPGPLIVSLHTWSGNYSQKDEIAPLCKQQNITYIHPNFRGENRTISACCSELALADIDDAITYATTNGNIDTNKIYVVGVSGGGYATLSTFMKSKHRIKNFSAWASIADLEAWYNESTILKAKYAADILDCTGSNEILNGEAARKKSPLYMNTPIGKIKNARLFIHCGIYNGLQGSVPITHSINFYNKLLTDLGVKDKSKYVSNKEKLDLLEFRRPLGNFGNIADRKICLQKVYGNIKLIVFTGDHEMLAQYALNEVLNN